MDKLIVQIQEKGETTLDFFLCLYYLVLCYYYP